MPSPAHLRIKGFSKKDFEKGWAVEVGSGMGRFTEAIRRYLLSEESQLVCIEPSEAIHKTRELFKSDARIHFVQADSRHLPFRKESLQFIILQGVLPHVAEEQKEIFSKAATFLLPKGLVQVNNSWYPFPKLEKRFHGIRKWTVPSTILAGLFSFIMAVLSPMLYLKCDAYYPFAGLLNWMLYSPHASLRVRWGQYYEILRVPKYDIFKDYQQTAYELKKSGFSKIELFAHPVSIKARLESSVEKEDPIERIRTQLKTYDLIMVGKGLLGEIAGKILDNYGLKVVFSVDTDLQGLPAPSNKYFVILATDYPRHSYETTLESLEEKGYRWGENITTMQIMMSAIKENKSHEDPDTR